MKKMDEIYVKLIDIDVITGDETPTIYPLNVFKNFLELEGFARADVEKIFRKSLMEMKFFLQVNGAFIEQNFQQKKNF